MRERIKVFSKSNIRAIGEDRRTRIELKDAKGNLGGSYGKRNGSRKLDSTEFIHNAVRESVALVSSRKNDHTAPISTVREVLKGKDLKVEITKITRTVSFEVSDKDIKDRAEFEKSRALEYIRTGKELTMAMRRYSARKGLPLPKALTRRTR